MLIPYSHIPGTFLPVPHTHHIWVCFQPTDKDAFSDRTTQPKRMWFSHDELTGNWRLIVNSCQQSEREMDTLTKGHTWKWQPASSGKIVWSGSRTTEKFWEAWTKLSPKWWVQLRKGTVLWFGSAVFSEPGLQGGTIGKCLDLKTRAWLEAFESSNDSSNISFIPQVLSFLTTFYSEFPPGNHNSISNSKCLNLWTLFPPSITFLPDASVFFLRWL